jgi:hypothetical protein
MKSAALLACLCLAFVSACAGGGKPKETPVHGSVEATVAAEKKRQAKVRPPVRIGPDVIVEKELAPIWDILVKVEDWGSWMSKITKVEPGAGLSPGAMIHWQWDEKNIESEIVSVKEKEEFAFKSCASSKKAVVKWALKSIGPKRTLISLRAEVPYGTASEIMDKLGPEMMEWMTSLQAAALKVETKK